MRSRPPRRLDRRQSSIGKSLSELRENCEASMFMSYRPLHTPHARSIRVTLAHGWHGWRATRLGKVVMQPRCVDSALWSTRAPTSFERRSTPPGRGAFPTITRGKASSSGTPRSRFSGLTPFLLIRTGLAELAFGSGTGHGTLMNQPCLNSPLNVGKRGAFEQHSADAFEGYLTDIPNVNVERGSIVDFYNAYNRIATPDILALFTLYSYDTGPFAGGQRRLKNNYVASSLTYDKLQRSGRRGPMRNHL